MRRAAKKTLGVLDELGSTSEEIAESLIKAGIKGRPYRAKDCPIRNYLRARLPYEDVVSSISGSSIKTRLGVVNVSHSEIVRQFMWGFDSGRWADLIA